MAHAQIVGQFPLRRLFVTCWLIYAAHWAPFAIREHFPAVTLAMHGTLNVEPFLGWIPDIFRGPSGGAFINNNPGASIAGALPLLIARPGLDALERWNDSFPPSVARSQRPESADRPAVRARREWYFLAVAFLTVAGLMAPVSALSVTALAATLRSSGLSPGSAGGAALVVGLATPIFVRTTYLNHNLLVCHAGLLGALLLWDRRREPVTAGHAVAAGVFGGFAVLCDYSGVLVVAILGLYAWSRSGDGVDGRVSRRFCIAACYALGALPLLLTLGAYQLWAFGNAHLPSQQFMPAIQPTTHGYRGFDWPSFDLAWMNFFDRRFGLFVVCPFLVLAVLAPFIRRGRFRLPARETYFILVFFGMFVLFCAANRYSELQYTTGIRYLVPTIPGLALLSLQVLQTVRPLLRNVILGASFLVAWLHAATHVYTFPVLIRLSWVQRMTEFGLIQRPGAVTVAVLVATTVAVLWIWNREIAAWHAGRRSIV